MAWDDSGGEEEAEDWEDEAWEFLRLVVAVIKEYRPHCKEGSPARLVLTDIELGAGVLFELICKGDEEGSLRSIGGCREAIAELLSLLR
jgi:hypothetical protein